MKKVDSEEVLETNLAQRAEQALDAQLKAPAEGEDTISVPDIASRDEKRVIYNVSQNLDDKLSPEDDRKIEVTPILTQVPVP